MIKSMNDAPVIFALAVQGPEILPEVAKKFKPDCMIATSRPDFANQINNIVVFPFLFRAILDTQSTQVNHEMYMAMAKAIAQLATEPLPDYVRSVSPSSNLTFGPDYLIPTPFDPRLLSRIATTVAEEAEITEVAKNPIKDYDGYRAYLDSISWNEQDRELDK